MYTASVFTRTHLHTVVTDAAVRAARRPVEVTGGAPLHPDLNALDLHVLVERRSEIIVLVLVLVRCRETRTHTGRRCIWCECEKKKWSQTQTQKKNKHGLDL